MLLDRLLENIGLEVEPFAICRVRKGWRLDMAKAGEVHLHFVVDGRGILRAPSAFKASLERFTLVLVPPGIRHRIEQAGDVEHDIGAKEAVCRTLPTGLDEEEVRSIQVFRRASASVAFITSIALRRDFCSSLGPSSWGRQFIQRSGGPSHERTYSAAPRSDIRPFVQCSTAHRCTSRAYQLPRAHKHDPSE